MFVPIALIKKKQSKQQCNNGKKWLWKNKKIS